HDAQSRAGRELELAEAVPLTELAQERREDPHAVAAHLGDRAVAVAVVHEPAGTGVLGEHRLPFGERGARHEPDDALAAHARRSHKARTSEASSSSSAALSSSSTKSLRVP